MHFGTKTDSFSFSPDEATFNVWQTNSKYNQYTD